MFLLVYRGIGTMMVEAQHAFAVSPTTTLGGRISLSEKSSTPPLRAYFTLLHHAISVKLLKHLLYQLAVYSSTCPVLRSVV